MAQPVVMTDPSDTVSRAVEAVISGRVQGVWYRGWTEGQAKRLGLSGWVRNNADGTVSALFAGPAGDVANMLALCWQGPDSAEVSGVATREVTPVPPSQGFEILR
ncbi:MAG: acylphosphatase [Pseudomonadota bacterium]